MKKNTRCLITGASGFVGRLLCSYFADRGWEVVAVRKSRALSGSLADKIHSEEICDLSSAEESLELLRRTTPALVVHAAALSSPAECERMPDLSYSSNVLATECLLRACECYPPENFFFLSSDMVFDGASAPPSGFHEASQVHPVSVYSRAKFEAECIVLGSTLRRSVLRLALCYGPGGGNTLGWLVEKLKCDSEVKLFTDEIRTPLYAGDLPRLIEELSCGESLPPILHVGGPERITRYDFGMVAARIYSLSSEKISPVLRAEVSSPFLRPEDLSLDSSLLRSQLSSPLANVETGILRSLTEDSWW